MSTYRIGVVGGSGLYQMKDLKVVEERKIETPFGDPSDPYLLGELEGKPVAFLPRHGRGHRLLPTELNYRANIYGMKTLGVERIVSISAVGSMKIEYKPTHIVVPDQFFDRTRHRPDTFFGNGIVGHVTFADPMCGAISDALFESAKEQGATSYRGGTYVCMEGPQFSTRAESKLYRSWGVDVIGMTNLQEAKLAREAEICYATMALVTDYDCWHESEEDVTVEAILAVLRANAEMAQKILRATVPRVAQRERGCACASALQYAIVTDPGRIPQKVKDDLAPIIGKYIK